MMWEEWKQAFAELFVEHRARKAGFVIGLVLGIAILVFGVWKTLFVLCCGGVGLYIGTRLDRGDDVIGQFLSSLQSRLPERFRN